MSIKMRKVLVETYYAEWLRSSIRMLMNEAYEDGMNNRFDPKENGWSELHKDFNRRIDDMLKIGKKKE